MKEQVIKNVIAEECTFGLDHSIYKGKRNGKNVYVINVYSREYDFNEENLYNNLEIKQLYMNGLGLIHEEERSVVLQLSDKGIKPYNTKRVGKYSTEYTYVID